MVATTSFGYDGDGGLGDRLLAAVLRGEKTATSSLAVEYLSGEPLPRVGQHSELVDQAGRRHGRIETTRVRIIPLDEVGDDVARDEGEEYLDSGVHPLAEARAYRWEFRPATPLRAVTPVRLPS